MKISIKLFSVFILLTVSFTVSSFAFQQDVVKFAKATSSDNIAANSSLNTIANEIEDKVPRDTSFNLINTRHKMAVDRLKQQAASIQEYAKANNFSSEYVFLLDMSIPSGKNRFFVYNLKLDSLVCSSLVSHGFGSTIKTSEDQLIFSNNNYSFKTSLGKYKIGNSYNGTYGLAYKLYGLDSTNSKAYERAIVLHSDVHVPVRETYPYKIFQSAGCPTVSPSFLPILSKYIRSSKKPILMWIYN